MSGKLAEIDYKRIFHYFEEICAVPRGSYHNENISRYLTEFAKNQGLSYQTDEYLNVVIFKEATAGYEDAPAVILQGHMDMVCEKESGVAHDFLTEGLDIDVDGDEIYARGTTLGGDDGIALAYALAILESSEYAHPRIEAVFTTDEETGMEGAAGLDVSNLSAGYMLNLDSEEEGILLASCAGGLRADCSLPVEHSMEKGQVVSLLVTGLKGGHSGAEIHHNRVNANLLMARLLFAMNNQAEFHLISVNGGLKDNAIPRESTAVLLIPEEEYEGFREAFQKCAGIIKAELFASEPDLELTVQEQGSGEREVYTPASFFKLMHMLLFAPNGVQVMSSDIEGLVESSLNLGKLITQEQEVHLTYSLRSSLRTYKQFMAEKLGCLTEFLGGQMHVHGEYPGWEYKKDSKLRELMIAVFKEQYGREPQVQAIHAGLECGLILEKLPGIDIVAIGPDMKDIHTPKERLSISSTKRVFDYIIKVLEEMKNLDAV